jgi:hypothetical protein
MVAKWRDQAARRQVRAGRCCRAYCHAQVPDLVGPQRGEDMMAFLYSWRFSSMTILFVADVVNQTPVPNLADRVHYPCVLSCFLSEESAWTALIVLMGCDVVGRL